MIPVLMKINELAEYSGLKSTTIRQMCKHGDLDFITIGRVYYVKVSSFLNIIENNSVIELHTEEEKRKRNEMLSKLSRKDVNNGMA